LYSLIVDCSTFQLVPGTYLINEELGEVVSIEHIAVDNIPSFAAMEGVNKIKLSGPTEYCIGLKEKLENKLALEYATNKIEIEVMEK
jgi:hypothetical protein